MSAQGIAADAPDLNQLIEEIAPLVAETSTGDIAESTNANDYGFDGSGQTIAVIDSGIAWDHAALGGGYGYGNKVVGGWDFAENDANPYDDGPAGFHGTHVAGIAAGDGSDFQGVAPGADLVGLRVFNDSGVGKIEWVESALQWVKNNLDSFENPITTVNMSLGADWQTETAADWNVISDELEALKSEGVFISVAAGNDFQDFFSKTLSYPAANENVVAVASHDADGQLSDFSQRDDQVLVAPGENIQSSVPDYLFGTRKSDQLLGASGTSMAAPYVAGASAVLRQAYGAMGYGEVDQDTLYQTFWDTSNQIYDSITETTFRQLDLDAAIASIVESVEANVEVTRVGTLTGGELIRGSISQPAEVDTFQFTAGAQGQIEFTFEATDQLDPTLKITNSDGQRVQLQLDGERAYIDVVAGETYRMEVASESGTGHYQISAEFQKASQATELGVVDSLEVVDFVSGDRTYSLTASKTGPMAFGFATDSLSGTIEVYDAMMNRLTSQQVQDGRVDFQFDVTEGESLTVLLKASGEVELAIDNLLSMQDGLLTVDGTEKADSFVVTDDDMLRVEVNGTRYSFQHADVSSIVIQGDAEQDSLQLSLSERYERTVLRQNRVDAFDGANTLRAIGFETIDVTGVGTLTVAGSESDDQIYGNYESMSITSGAARATGHGFAMMIADGKGGSDSIHLQGDDGNDVLHSKNDYSVLRSGDNSSRLIAINYEELVVDGSDGHDTANLFGSETDDQLTLGEDLVEVNNDRTTLSATEFERATAFSGNGSDTVVFTDSEGNDRFLFADGTSQLITDGVNMVAHDFTQIVVDATGGYDVAQISGSVANDQLNATREQTTFRAGITAIEMNHFSRVNVVANFQGYDSAEIVGTDGDDQFIVDSTSGSVIFDGGAIVRTVGFGDVSFAGGAGYDTSFLTGSVGADVLDVNSERAIFRTGKIQTVAREVESTRLNGAGGGDAVYLDDVQSLDVIAAIGDRAVAVLEQHRIEATEFDFLEASAVDGVIATYDMERVDFEAVLRGQWQQR
ncbi:S8 family peptidase [Mariniblastus fucicola]|nr:S8 family serine peptidase [Mariniblastus fucicola]